MSAGTRQPDGETAMTAVACDIAVSEMFGVPLDRICGYIVIAVDHSGPPGEHRNQVTTGPGHEDWPWTIRKLRQVADDLEKGGF